MNRVLKIFGQCIGVMFIVLGICWIVFFNEKLHGITDILIGTFIYLLAASVDET